MKMNVKDKPILSVNDVSEVIELYKKIKKNQRFSDAAARYIARKEWELEHKNKLANAIPRGGKNKVLRRMAHLLDKAYSVENYKLAQCLKRKVRDDRGRLKKFNQKDYGYKKASCDIKIKNHFKVLNKHWKPIGFAVSFGKHRSKIILVKSVVGNDRNKPDVTPIRDQTP